MALPPMISKAGNKVYLSKEFENEDVKQFLVDNYLKMTTMELAKKLNSTMPKVNGALMYFGLSKGIKGTPLSGEEFISLKKLNKLKDSLFCIHIRIPKKRHLINDIAIRLILILEQCSV